jgi:uncharacterized membrane protein YidH (DUF202 family)
MRFGRNAEPLGLVAGFLLWGFAFVTLYGGHGFACGVGVAPDHHDGTTRLALVAALLSFVVAHAALAWWFWKRLQRAESHTLYFVRLASFILAVAALVATVWTLGAPLFLSICV